MTKQRILVVDDDVSALKFARSLLEQAGYDVEAVASPAEAIAQSEQESYDLVVSDYEMPGMNGVELILRLGRRAILCTGNRKDATDYATAVGLPSLPILEKPYPPTLLLTKIRELLT